MRGLLDAIDPGLRLVRLWTRESAGLKATVPSPDSIVRISVNWDANWLGRVLHLGSGG